MRRGEGNTFVLVAAQPARSGANISLVGLARRVIVESMFCVCAPPVSSELKYLNMISINITIIICPHNFPQLSRFWHLIGSFTRSCWKTSAKCSTKITLISQSVNFTLTTWYAISNLQWSVVLLLTQSEKRSQARLPGCFSCQQLWQGQHLHPLPLDVAWQWEHDSLDGCYLVTPEILSIYWCFCCHHGKHHQKKQLCYLRMGC